MKVDVVEEMYKVEMQIKKEIVKKLTSSLDLLKCEEETPLEVVNFRNDCAYILENFVKYHRSTLIISNLHDNILRGLSLHIKYILKSCNSFNGQTCDSSSEESMKNIVESCKMKSFAYLIFSIVSILNSIKSFLSEDVENSLEYSKDSFKNSVKYLAEKEEKKSWHSSIKGSKNYDESRRMAIEAKENVFSDYKQMMEEDHAPLPAV